MNAVAPVDVEMATSTEHGPVPWRGTSKGVRRGVVGAAVGLCLHNSSCKQLLAQPSDQHASDQFLGDLQRIPGVEASGQRLGAFGQRGDYVRAPASICRRSSVI